jgi:hypothetical protein
MRRFPPFAIMAALAVLAPAAAHGQTLTDPAGDNCRDYTTPTGNFCGPDITSAKFSLPGDGFLHVNVTYASIPPLIIGGTQIEQTSEHIEMGLYPKTATAPDFTALTYRFSKWTSTTWKLQQKTDNLRPVADGSATPGPLGIELRVPLGPLGDPKNYRYALNAGIVGEVIPEHPDLAPNSGLFDLGAAAPSKSKKKCKKKGRKGKKASTAAKPTKKGCKKKGK